MIHRFHTFVSAITLCYKSIQRIKAAEMTEFGLKGTHVMCLFYLHHEPAGLTAAQLCSRCEEDKAAISRTLAELTEKGYILPAQDGGKKKYRALMQLTDAGVEIAEKVDILIAQWVTAGGAGLSDEEREVFYRTLTIIAENLRNKGLQGPTDHH